MRPDLDLDPDGLAAATAHAAALGLDLDDLARALRHPGPAADERREIGRVVAGAAHEMTAAARTFREVAGAVRRAELDAVSAADGVVGER
ncbi:hypothetical protein ACL02T_18535 [Pseudonocardia sp. RS010]|uniref:hypothetical protein n=1 Tax=Pseudonocardia sp. RS010 TaxID=3385979 RepID=UPI00399FDA3E